MEDALPPRDENDLEFARAVRWSDSVPLKDFVFLAARALGALEAADDQNSHADSDQNGQRVRIRRNQVSKFAHKPVQHTLPPARPLRRFTAGKEEQRRRSPGATSVAPFLQGWPW